MDRTRKIADADHLQEELNFLKYIFTQHGYAPGDINRLIYRKRTRRGRPRQTSGWDSFLHPVMNRIVHILK